MSNTQKILFVIFLNFILLAIIALPLMYLWNACIVGLFPGVGEIGWVHSIGLLIISNLLLKNEVSITTKDLE